MGEGWTVLRGWEPVSLRACTDEPELLEKCSQLLTFPKTTLLLGHHKKKILLRKPGWRLRFCMWQFPKWWCCWSYNTSNSKAKLESSSLQKENIRKQLPRGYYYLPVFYFPVTFSQRENGRFHTSLALLTHKNPWTVGVARDDRTGSISVPR